MNKPIVPVAVLAGFLICAGCSSSAVDQKRQAEEDYRSGRITRQEYEQLIDRIHADNAWRDMEVRAGGPIEFKE